MLKMMLMRLRREKDDLHILHTCIYSYASNIRLCLCVVVGYLGGLAVVIECKVHPGLCIILISLYI